MRAYKKWGSNKKRKKQGIKRLLSVMKPQEVKFTFTTCVKIVRQSFFNLILKGWLLRSKKENIYTFRY